MKNTGKCFIPLEEQLPEDLRPDEPLLPFPGVEPPVREQRQGWPYPEWLRRLGRLRPPEGTD